MEKSPISSASAVARFALSLDSFLIAASVAALMENSDLIASSFIVIVSFLKYVSVYLK